MTNYDKLVELLESIEQQATPGTDDEWAGNIAEEALPLARQLIEENGDLLAENGRLVEERGDLLVQLAERQSLLDENRQLREGARENHEAWGEKYRDLQARLSAAEEENRRLIHENPFMTAAPQLIDHLEAKLERAEVVVEVAKTAQTHLHQSHPLHAVIRQYEEGK